ncbi:RNA-binding protein, partial [Leptospira interrogans]|nr:RNA-binding protein [Leptospira interrogans]
MVASLVEFPEEIVIREIEGEEQNIIERT